MPRRRSEDQRRDDSKQARGRPAAPVWEDYVEGKVTLWEARLRGSVQDWAEWRQLTLASVEEQNRVVDELLASGEAVLDETRTEVNESLARAQDSDNWRFLMVHLLSSVLRRRPQYGIDFGVNARRKKQSTAWFVWETLIKPWLPARRRQTSLGYRTEDAAVWRAALSWLLAASGNEACTSVLLPSTHVAKTSPTERTLKRQRRAEDEPSLRSFATALHQVLGSRGAVRREERPWDLGQVARDRLRPDDVLRNDPDVRKALFLAYVRLGGPEGDVTGREAPLRRLAVLLAACQPLLWPPAIRTDHVRGKHRALKAETNRLRRELNLRGRPRPR